MKGQAEDLRESTEEEDFRKSQGCHSLVWF